MCEPVFSVSEALHKFNKQYDKAYRVVDLAAAVGVSPDTISRLSIGSQFYIVYKIAYQLYLWYPDFSPSWSFEAYLSTFLLLSDDFKLSPLVYSAPFFRCSN